MSDLLMTRSAVISECTFYRWRLDRDLGTGGPSAAICGVNPSTADAEKDDHTIRKDMGFARRLGWGRIIKANKFGLRATDVNELKVARDPIGPENDLYLREIFQEADVVVFAWGPLSKLPKQLRSRWKAVAAIARDAGKTPMCWGTAKDGHPLHTLTLAYDTPFVPWKAPAHA
jgi:hypothetical protein